MILATNTPHAFWAAQKQSDFINFVSIWKQVYVKDHKNSKFQYYRLIHSFIHLNQRMIQQKKTLNEGLGRLPEKLALIDTGSL
jgi:hypothetical protein